MQTNDTIRIRVEPAPMGRLVGWSVRCGGCKSTTFVPTRNKHLAVEVAQTHSDAVHEGRGVLAVRK